MAKGKRATSSRQSSVSSSEETNTNKEGNIDVTQSIDRVIEGSGCKKDVSGDIEEHPASKRHSTTEDTRKNEPLWVNDCGIYIVQT